MGSAWRWTTFQVPSSGLKIIVALERVRGDLLPSPGSSAPTEASATFQEAPCSRKFGALREAGETVCLGEKACTGISAQVQRETSRPPAGARYGELIVIVTLQGYDGTNENKAR